MQISNDFSIEKLSSGSLENKTIKPVERSSSESSGLSSYSSDSTIAKTTAYFARRRKFRPFSNKTSLAHSLSLRHEVASATKGEVPSDSFESDSYKTTMDAVVGPGKQFLTEVIKKMNSYVTPAHKKHLLSHTPTLSAYQSLEEINIASELITSVENSEHLMSLRTPAFKLPLTEGKPLNKAKQEIDIRKKSEKKKHPEKPLALDNANQVNSKQDLNKSSNEASRSTLHSRSSRSTSGSVLKTPTPKVMNYTKTVIKTSMSDRRPKKATSNITTSKSKASLNSSRKINTATERLYTGRPAKVESAGALGKRKPKRKIKQKNMKIPVVDLAAEARKYHEELCKDEVVREGEFNERIMKLRFKSGESKKDIMKMLGINEDEQRISMEQFIVQSNLDKQNENKKFENLMSAENV